MPMMPPKHRPLGWQPRPPKPTEGFYGTQEWKRIRTSVKERDLGVCRGATWTPALGFSRWLCGKPGWRVDHIVPRTENGCDDPSNLRLLCTGCDARRHLEKTNKWRS